MSKEDWKSAKYEKEMKQLTLSFWITIVLIGLLIIIIMYPLHTASEKIELLKAVIPVVTFGFGYLFGERKTKDSV